MSYTVQVFDLAVDRRGDAAESRSVGAARILQVLDVPVGASGVQLRIDDQPDFIPLAVGFRLEKCTGLIGRITLQNAPTGGLLKLYVGNDPVPFGSGAGAAAGADLLPFLDTVWPGGGTVLAGGSAFALSGRTRWGPSFANFWAAKDGAAGDGMVVYKGRLCAGFTMGGGAICGHGVLEGSMNPLLVRPAATSFRMMRQARVWRIRFLMAMQGGANWTRETGIALLLGAGAAPGWVGLGNCGMGVVGDGASGWRFVSQLVAGAPGSFAESVPLTWPAGVTEWTTVGLEILSANGASEALFRLLLNDVPVIARSWGAGTVLPDYTALANAARFWPYVRAGDGALAGSLNIAEVECYAGPCDSSGAEVF